MVKCEVNKTFLPIKAVYFFYLSGKAVLPFYLPVFFTQLGLSAVHIGIIFGIEPFIGFVGKPLWGIIADKYNKHKLILLTAMIGAMMFTMACRFIPPYKYHMENINKLGNQSMCNTSIGVSVEQSIDPGTIVTVLNKSIIQRDVSWTAAKILCDSCCVPKPAQIPFDENILQECNQMSKYWNCKTCLPPQGLQCNRTNNTETNSTLNQQNCSSSTLEDLVRFIITPHSTVPQNSTQARTLCPEVCTFGGKKELFQCDCPSVVGVEPSLPVAYSNVPIEPSDLYLSYLANETDVCNITEPVQLVSGNQSISFWLSIMLTQLSAVFGCIVFPILDMTVYELLGDNRGDYGKQRLWGAFGFGVFAFISGLMMDVFSGDFTASEKNYDSAFAMYIILVIIAAVIATQLQIPTQQVPQSLFSSLSLLLRQPDILAFLLLVLVMGLCMGVIMVFLFVFLQEMGAPQVLMGLSLTVTCIAEAPFLFFSGHLIKRFGHKGVFYLVLLSYIIRFLGYSFITNPWMVLPLELLHGITFGAMYAAVTSYASIIAPPGMALTVQALVQACLMGAGKGLGGLLGGIVYKCYSGKVLFRSCSGLCFITGLLYWIVQFCVVHRTPFYSKFRTRNESVSLQEPGEETAADRDILELLEEDDIMMPHNKMSSRVMKLNLRSVHRPHQIAKYDQDAEAARGLILDLSPVVSDVSPPKVAMEISPSVTSVSSRIPMLETDSRQPTIGEDSDSEPPYRPPALGMETFYIDDQIEDIAMEYDMGMGSSALDHNDL
ncbi:major facilitator superfamily domain-containing protein 6-like [Glandiceps talaboti]